MEMGGKENSQEDLLGLLVDIHGKEYKLPDYTIKQIYDAIPAECYKRDVLKSLSYVFQDVALIALTFYIFQTYVTPDIVPFILVNILPSSSLKTEGAVCKILAPVLMLCKLEKITDSIFFRSALLSGHSTLFFKASI